MEKIMILIFFWLTKWGSCIQHSFKKYLKPLVLSILGLNEFLWYTDTDCGHFFQNTLIYTCTVLSTNSITGNSLVVQWLGLHAFTAGARVQSLVRELKSCVPCGVAKNNNNHKVSFKKKNTTISVTDALCTALDPCLRAALVNHDFKWSTATGQDHQRHRPAIVESSHLSGGCAHELEDYLVHINSFAVSSKHFLTTLAYYEIKYGELKICRPFESRCCITLFKKKQDEISVMKCCFSLLGWHTGCLGWFVGWTG